MDVIFAQYYEDLLRAQYRVSEVIQQNLPRGTIREDFLRDLVLERKGSLRGKKGIVTKGGRQSGECDIIFYDHTATISPLGEMVMIEPRFCKLILEVKSKATGTDLEKTNTNCGTIKMIDTTTQPLCGLFCYNIALKKDTILNRFGWRYDKDLENWYDDGSITPKYPNIDFIVCIACLEEDDTCTEQQLFLIKDVSSGRYILQLEYPIIKNFFGVTDNL